MSQWKVWCSCFIVSLILFVFALAAFFLTYNRNQELRKKYEAEVIEKNRANDQYDKIFRDRADLREIVRGESDPFPPVEELQKELERAEQDINAARKDLGMAEVTMSHLVEPYKHIKELFTAYKDERDTAINELEAKSQGYEVGMKNRDSTLESYKQQLAARGAEVADAQKKLLDCENNANAEKAQLTEELARVQEEAADEKILHSRQTQKLQNAINTLEIKLAKLEEQIRKDETFEDIEPDGRLVDVSPTLGKGWIDLGRRDHLMTGLTFRVYQRLKGGKKLEKGLIEVRKVEETYAEVHIVNEIDPLGSPITAGDLISSPFYDRREKPIFVIAGQLESQDHTIDYIRAKLRDYGVELRPSVDIHTSFLVALRDYETTPEYKVAQSLGVPIIREKDLLSFIGN